MKTLLFPFILFISIYSSTINSQVADWIIPGPAMGNDVEVNFYNNIFVSGDIPTGTTQIGSYSFTSAGMRDVIVQKYDLEGSLKWATQIGGPNEDYNAHIVSDNFGNVWVSGSYEGSIDIGGTVFNSTAFSDIYIAKLDGQTGNVLFAESIGSVGSMSDWDLGVDANGNIYVSGSYSTELFYGVTSVLTGNSNDAFILKIDNSGNHIFTFGVSGSSFEGIYSFAADEYGNTYCGGFSTSPNTDLGDSSVVLSQSTYFIAKFDSLGSLVWYKNPSFQGVFNEIVIDGRGNFYFAGDLTGNADFDGNLLTVTGGQDILLGKSDTSGNFLWVKNYGAFGSDSGKDIACDKLGDLYISGNFSESFNFGQFPVDASPNFQSQFIAKVDASGTEVWIENGIGAGAEGTCFGVAVSRRNDVFMTGFGIGNMDIGGLSSNLNGGHLSRFSDKSNVISGYVFHDVNANGVKDAGENGIPNVILQKDAGPYVAVSQNDGLYSIYADTGTYSVSIPNIPSYYSLTTPPSITVTFPGNSTHDSGNNFGLSRTPSINDLRVDLTPITGVRAGFPLVYLLTYKNVGTTIQNGIVTLNYDSNLIYSNSLPSEDSQNGQELTWDVGSLDPGDIGTITVYFDIPTSMVIDDLILSIANIDPVIGDNEPLDNSFADSSLVTGPYDPNDKKVDKEVLFNVSNQDWLEYMIRFQNVGNDTSFNVLVVDTMTSYLDLATMEILATSHQPMDFSIVNGNTAEFFFENILLPDSTTDEPGSNGFVKFRVKHLQGIPYNDSINNFVDIYFDFNPAVRTNTASTVVLDSVTSIIEYGKKKSIKIYPNPNNGNFRIQFLPDYGKNSISLFDISGKLLRNYKTDSNVEIDLDISISNLKSGLYLLVVNDGVHSYIKKIIKE